MASPSSRGPIVRVAARFLVLAAVGWLAWPLVGRAFSTGFQRLAGATLNDHEFGTGGRADFLPFRQRIASGPEQDASWSAKVELRIDGVEQRHTMLVNPRRLAYLPLVTFVATTFAMGLSLRRTAVALLLGSAALTLLSLASAWIIVAWLFASVPGLVYTLSEFQRLGLQLLYEGFVTPIANKFIIAILLGLACAKLATFLCRKRSRAV